MEKTNPRKKSYFFIYLACAVVFALLLRLFIFEFVIISGDSMLPTLHSQEMIVVTKAFYTPARGDIIVFHTDMEKNLVKRVIALPGEKLEIKDGVIFVNDQALDTAYQYQGEDDNYPAAIVPEGSYFVMGDNRPNSLDSRIIGTIERNQILGKMAFVIWK